MDGPGHSEASSATRASTCDIRGQVIPKAGRLFKRGAVQTSLLYRIDELHGNPRQGFRGVTRALVVVVFARFRGLGLSGASYSDNPKTPIIDFRIFGVKRSPIIR